MIIQCEAVSKRYQAGFEGLKHVTFSIETGELVFLTGHSGAGKSTLLQLLAAIKRPTSGRVIVDGHDLGSLPAKKIPAFRRELGLIFQDPNLLAQKTIFENVALPLLITGMPLSVCEKRVRTALDLVGLKQKESLYPGHLSGGEQQRVSIARAIVHKPKLILADEPTGNLDPTLSIEIMSLFKKLNHFGVSIIIATHELSLVAQSNKRVLVLEKGGLV